MGSSRYPKNVCPWDSVRVEVDNEISPRLTKTEGGHVNVSGAADNRLVH